MSMHLLSRFHGLSCKCCKVFTNVFNTKARLVYFISMDGYDSGPPIKEVFLEPSALLLEHYVVQCTNSITWKINLGLLI